MIKKLFLLFALLVASQMAIGQTVIQNISPYNFVLTSLKLTKAVCSTCSLKSILIPQATQAYEFSSSSGSVVFGYDVNEGSQYVGHIAVTASPTSVVISNGVGASIVQGSESYQINYVPLSPLWTSAFSSLSNWKTNNWKVSSLPSWGSGNIQVRPSTANSDTSPKGDNYIRIFYPAGSADYSSQPPIGGAQFYGAMVNTSQPITLSYYLRLPTNFPFLSPSRGTTLGKLPGLYGGIGNTGSKVPTGYDGWTTRFMWCDVSSVTYKTISAGGELLQFTYGSNKGAGGTINGVFLGCGTWSFVADGLWHNLQQTIHLNTPGVANGRIDVCYDGNPIFSQSNIMFRLDSSLQTNGILFQTFFGGSGKEYATPISTYADFADFALYAYPASAAPGLCVTNIP